jgi:hypothetical protein
MASYRGRSTSFVERLSNYLQQVSLKGALAGSATYYLCNTTLTLPYYISIYSHFKSIGVPDAARASELEHLVVETLWLKLLLFSIGWASCMAGGYVAARVARRAPIPNSLLASAPLLAYALWFVGTGRGAPYPVTSLDIASIVANSAFFAMGAHLWVKRTKRVIASAQLSVGAGRER